MPTLQDILEKDMGLGEEQPTEKVAEQAEDKDIEKLAMEIGLVDSTDEAGSASQEEKTPLTKEANMSLEHLYEDLFPGDADVVGGPQEKVAEEDKTAAVEEAMGEVAYDHFEKCVDGHIAKIAELYETEFEKEAKLPGPTMDNNEVVSDKAIDTTPVVDDEIKDMHPAGAVGKYEHKAHGEGELKKQAFRKQLLLSQLDQ